MGHMIFMTLIHAALNVESVGDDDVADWRSLPRLVPDRNDGGWHMPDRCPRIPLTFSIIARKRCWRASLPDVTNGIGRISFALDVCVSHCGTYP
ncbi:hypothetical protein [Bifidobacterium aquikefiri]|uniref:hypothetical protein n=1 Tax=Bifidobacterium aquikefiri TaxID=1653207 RepID=UPI0023F50759|nr:hypothetical protein [Bifidobacterium aquikefiri]